MINPLLPQVNGAERLSVPNDLDTAQPVQHFARGGVIVPFQRPFLRGSDREYLEARQKEYDKYVADANAYNEALTKYQTEVYNPYKTSVEAFNAAADKYNTEIYNPYLSQVDEYNRAAAAYNTDVYQPYVSSYDAYAKAVEAWNAGDRTSDYAGPAAPTLKPFEMVAPTQPASFSMTAPKLASEFSMARPEMPFSEEDITKFQKEAAERAQFDAGQRGLAIEAVNDPAKYNLSGFSISPRMFAQGGVVKNSAKDMLSKIKPQKFALGGLGERFSRLDPEEGITRDDFGEGRLGSAAYQSAVGEGGIGLDAMNQNIRNFFANDPDEAAALAAMQQYGVTDDDIIRATGKGLAARYPRRAAPTTNQVIADAVNTGASNIANTAAAAQPVSAEPILSPEAFNSIWSIMGGGVGGPSAETLRRLRGEPEEEAPTPQPAAQAPAGSAAADLAAVDRIMPTQETEQITGVRPSLRAATAEDLLAALKMSVGRNPNADPDGPGPAQAPAVTPAQVERLNVAGPASLQALEQGRLDSADLQALMSSATRGGTLVTNASEDLAQLPASTGAVYPRDFVGPLPPGAERATGRLGRRLLTEGELEDLYISPSDFVDMRRTIMPVTDRRTADGGTTRVPNPGDPDFVGPLPPTGGTTPRTGGPGDTPSVTTGGTATTGGTTATTGGTGGTTGGGTTTTAPVDTRSAGVRAATGQGGIGLDKYYENILKWFTDNPNATYDDINKAQDQWGVSDQDINDAFGRSGSASRAMLYALNSADFAQTTGGRGGLAGMNYNINNWLKANPKASVGDIYEAMIKWDLNTGDFRRATGMTPTEYFASLQKPPITPITPGGTGTIPPIVGGTGTTPKPGGTTTTTPGGGTATRVPGSIVPIPDLAAVPGFDRPNVPLPGISTGVARTPSSGGGDGMVDIQVVVYGPDGKMYSSPASARAAGVFNYTMTPPVTAQPTPGSTPGTVGSPNAGSIPVANPSTPGAIPIAKPAVPSLPGFTPGAPQFFGPGTPANRAPGLTPGTVPMSYNPLAAYTGPSPTALLQQNPNLAPTIIGGGANLGVMTDRLGNKIYAPGMPPPGFAAGGEVSGEFAGVQGTGRSGGPVSDTPYLHRTPDAERLRLNQEEAAARMARKAEIRRQMDQNGATMFVTGTGYAPGGEFGGGTYRGGNVPIATPVSQRFSDDSGLVPSFPGVPSMPMSQRFSDDSGLVPRGLPRRAGTAQEMLEEQRLMGFASGGLAQATAAQNAANLADEDDDGISLPNPAAPSAETSPTGAQAMLASLPKTQVSTKSSPTSASVKRTSKAMLTDKMGQPKGMAMEMEQLSAAKTPAPEGKEPESARSQMEALALAYKLREREALDTAKGLMKATFSRPSLERPSLLKGKLTKKRFADGGEAKKARGGETNESAARRLPAPSITNATLWADTVSRDMFPREKDDVKRDAARHMLAAAIMADKTSPRIAETLGKLYEFKEAPIRTAGHWMGLSKPRPDYPTDVHNNALGASLSRLTADPEKLTQAVREAIRQGTVDIQPGKAALVPDPGRAMTYNTGDTPAEPPQYRHGGAVKHRRA